MIRSGTAPIVQRRTAAIALVAAAATGLFLRLYQLDLQILIDDEWHAIIKLASADYAGIARTFGVSDHSIPLTLLYEWIANQGRLSEMAMYAPALASGIALWVIAVALARRSMTPLALSTFAFLLATSPLLVLYSRQARPYAITLLLTLAAILSTYRWSRGGGRRYAVLYVVCGVTAIYLHLIVAPVVLGVWLVLFLEWCGKRDRAVAELRAMIGWAAVALTIVTLLLAPVIVFDWYALRAKANGDTIALPALWRAWSMFTGTAWPWLAILCAILIVIGIVDLARRHRGPTMFVSALVLLQILAVLLSGALWLNHPLVLTRYLLVCLPPTLFALATGFAWACERMLPPLARPPALAALVLALILSGPLAGALAYPNSFFAHYIHFFDVDPAENPVIPVLQSGPMPAFYSELAALPPGSRTIIEAPWRFESIFNRLPLFQQVHRQKVKIGLVGRLCATDLRGEEPLYFRNEFRLLVDLAQAPDVLRQHADFVVFHKQLELANMAPPWTLEDGRALPRVDACIAAFREMFGAPVFEDESITAFALGPR